MRARLLTFLTLCSFVTFAEVTESTYRNDAIGLEITKPSEWFFLSVNDTFENLEHVSPIDKDIQDELKSKYVMLSISKYRNPEKRSDITPTIRVMVVKCSEQLKDKVPREVLESSCARRSKIYQEYEYILRPIVTNLPNKGGARAITEYSVTDLYDRTFNIRNETWITKHGDHIFTFSFMASTEGSNAISKAEISKVIESIKLK